MNEKEKIGNPIQYAANQNQVLEKSAILIKATMWSQSRTPEFEIIALKTINNNNFDGRNLFDVNKMKKLGYHFELIGRKLS